MLVKKVALVNLGDGRKYPQIDEGLGLASAGLEWIASYLEANDVLTTIIDQSMYGLSEEQTVKEILESDANLVGFNPLSNHRSSFQRIVAKVKQARSSVVSVIGGYDATFRSLADYREVDLLVRGRGEKAMLAIIQCLQKGKDFADIQGVAYKTKGMAVEKLNERAEALPFEQLPLPRRQNLDYLVISGEPISIAVSRGCDYGCKFCSTPAMCPEGRQERPLELVLQEIDYLLKAGAKRFSFWDEDLFGVRRQSLARADKIIQYIKDKGGIITFSFICAPGVIQAERLDYLRQWERVVNRLYIGVEGGCRHALKALGNQSGTQRQNERAIQIVRKYDIGLQIGFIMFNPYSTFDELTESAQFLYRNNEAVNNISFFHHLRPYPGTEMFNQLKDDNLLIEEESDGEIDRYVDLPYHFKCDLNAGRSIKDFAVAMGEMSVNQRTGESDRLNNEIYMRLVELGLGKKIFSNEETNSEVIEKYRILRRGISDLNFNFFTNSLKTFRNNDEIKFGELKEKYLTQLDEFLPQLSQIKQGGKLSC